MACPAFPVMPTTLDMFTILPQRARIMPIMAALVVWKALVRSVRRMSSQSSVFIRASRLSRTTPALLTSTSTWPMAFIICWTASPSQTSHWTASAAMCARIS